MKTVAHLRRLRIVRTAAKPSGYGFAGGHKIERLAPMPTAEQISIRSRAQSILSRNGVRAELPDYEKALRILAEHEHEVDSYCRVPPARQPSFPARAGVSAARNLSMPVASEHTATPSRRTGAAGSIFNIKESTP